MFGVSKSQITMAVGVIIGSIVWKKYLNAPMANLLPKGNA